MLRSTAEFFNTNDLNGGFSSLKQFQTFEEIRFGQTRVSFFRLDTDINTPKNIALQESMKGESESPIHGPLSMKII